MVSNNKKKSQLKMAFFTVCFIFFSHIAYARHSIKFHAEEGYVALFERENRRFINDFMSALNLVQDEFHFEYQINPSRRFVILLEENAVDAVFLLDQSWVEGSLSKMDSSSFYIDLKNQIFTLKKPGITQDYFSNTAKLSKVGMFGYYYKIFDYKRNPTLLKSKYKASLVKREVNIIKMVESKRVEMGIIGDMFTKYLHKDGQIDINNFYFYEVPDAVYKPRMFLKKGIPLTKAKLDNYILTLKEKGILQSIFSYYGILPNIQSWLDETSKQ